MALFGGQSEALQLVIKAKDEASQTIKKVEGNFSSMSKSMKVGLGVLTAVGAGAVIAGKRMIELSASFESSIGNLRTLIGDDEAGIKNMRDGILQLTKTIPKSADELGAAAYNILSAGITDSAQALQVLEASGKLAVAGLGDTTQAVNIVTSAINAFELDASKADQVANTVFSTVRAGKTTVAELATSFGNVAASAHGAGVSFEETQAATAALTLAGFRTATAQERLRALFDELTRTSGTLSDKMDDLGISHDKATIKADGFKSILDKLLDSANGDTIAFKNMFSSVEAGGAALALATSQSQSYDDILASMEEGVGDLSEAFNAQADTVENQYKLAINNMNAVLIDLGTKTLPTLSRALVWVGEAFDAVFGDASSQAINFYNRNIKASEEMLGKLDVKMREAVEAQDQSTISTIKSAKSNEILKKKLMEARIEEDKLTKQLDKSGGMWDIISGKQAGVATSLNLVQSRIKNLSAQMNGFKTEEGQVFKQELIEEDARLKELKDSLESAASGVDKLGGAASKNTESIDKLTDKYASMKDKVTEVLESIEEKHIESMGKIREEIEATQSKINDLYKDRNEQVLDARSEFAEKYVSIEEKIKAKQQELAQARAQADNADGMRRVRELEDWINANQSALIKYQDLALSVQSEIAKAREEYYMSEAEKAAIAFKEKTNNIEIEFRLKFYQYQNELKALEQKQANEKKMYQKQIDQVTALFSRGGDLYREELNRREKMTSEYINTEIQKWNALADAINRASRGNFTRLPSYQSSFGQREAGGIIPGPKGSPVPVIMHGGEQVIPASQVKGGSPSINVNINYPSVRNDSDLATIKKQIEQTFRGVMQNNKLAF